MGIHALQLLPLVALLLSRHGRRLGLGTETQVGLVHVAGLGYLGVVVLLVWQALRSEPVTWPGVATLAAAGVLLAGMAAAVFLAALRPTATQQAEQVSRHADDAASPSTMPAPADGGLAGTRQRQVSGSPRTLNAGRSTGRTTRSPHLPGESSRSPSATPPDTGPTTPPRSCD